MVKSFAGTLSDISAYGPLQSADGKQSFELSIVRETNKGLTVHIKGVDDRNAAEALKGTELYIPRAKLPEPEDGAFYHTDLIGLRTIDPDGRPFGIVKAVQNYGAGDILEIKRDDSAPDDMIPFTAAFAPDVSLQDGTVTIIVPDTVTAEESPDEVLEDEPGSGKD